MPDLFIRLPGSTPHVRSVFGRVGKSPLIRGSPTSGTRGRVGRPEAPLPLLPFNLYLSYEFSLRPSCLPPVPPSFLSTERFSRSVRRASCESRTPKIHQSSLRQTDGLHHCLPNNNQARDRERRLGLLRFRINVEGIQDMFPPFPDMRSVGAVIYHLPLCRCQLQPHPT